MLKALIYIVKKIKIKKTKKVKYKACAKMYALYIILKKTLKKRAI